ncbi:transporter substrate-binding domain-containing protein [Aliiglaciecola sp. CAU 1673]|uniref:substrate-binding periplasmic protein n=1 Tax=Aliiglaciecola sp. CAU 1673 TaxID=3032595 RepID=UPI0023DADB8E|nr:transporter substrate-binding domain-containing protein [Aliiglaciecola sp. CAU 1673]MDF2179326.1 transporter substrate-binding domain-containing protein [Aliiglaciecola sp. CAU 1673]
MSFPPFLLTLAIFLSVFHNALNACELRVRMFEFPPQAMQQEDSSWQGMDVDYSEALLKRVGCEARFINVPWARGLKMLREGELDMMLNLSDIDDRRDYIHFIGPQRVETLRLVSRKGALPMVSTWQDMQMLDAVLIHQRGTYLGQGMEEVLAQNKELSDALVPLILDMRRIDMVIKGRADGFFMETSHLAYQLANDPSYQLIDIHPLEIYSEPVYFGISKKSVAQALINKLQEAYLQMVIEGELQHIDNRYPKYF